jgi:hypothetical protein
MIWRQGRRVPINVYEDGENGESRPVCQCHTALDAALIVRAVNRWRARLDAKDVEQVSRAPFCEADREGLLGVEQKLKREREREKQENG